MLVSEITNSMTYIGITNDLTRRLKQHNGLCCGGAIYTYKCRPWKVYGYVRGFGEDKRLVLKFEWRWKFLSRKEKGSSIEKRMKGLQKVLSIPEFISLEFVNLNL
jgi:predicted GIY-YIG superfamily endonuclease